MTTPGKGAARQGSGGPRRLAGAATDHSRARLTDLCAPGTPAGEAAALANRYVAVGEAPPAALVELLLTDCAKQEAGR